MLTVETFLIDIDVTITVPVTRRMRSTDIIQSLYTYDISEYKIQAVMKYSGSTAVRVRRSDNTVNK